jgi:hypothetical protein
MSEKGKDLPKQETDSHETTDNEQEISRRDFMKRASQVAALSVFGVLAFDSVVDGVLQRISDMRAMGALSRVASEELARHRLSYYADAGVLLATCDVGNPFSGCDNTCSAGYSCTTQSAISCNNFNCNDSPFGCTGRDNTCGPPSGNTCVQVYNCNENYDTCSPVTCKPTYNQYYC